jgi:hypothetical protein
MTPWGGPATDSGAQQKRAPPMPASVIDEVLPSYPMHTGTATAGSLSASTVMAMRLVRRLNRSGKQSP